MASTVVMDNINRRHGSHGHHSSGGGHGQFHYHDHERHAMLAPDEAKKQRNLAKAKLLSFLEKREAGSLVAEQNVYGSAIVLPQIARSLEWPDMMVRFVVRNMFFLFLNIVVQTMLLYYVSKEGQVVNKFGGQMYLCDFGAALERDMCPDGQGCTGPLGTHISPPRLYSWAAIVDRAFTRDSMLAIFPEKKDEIDKLVDVGEYGLESYGCRILCVFLFMIAMISEFWVTLDMFRLIYYIPTAAESWVSYDVPEWESKDRVKEIRGLSELDLVSLKVAGMPMRWKIFNWVCICSPKAVLWFTLCRIGVAFLMDTAAMDDLIVNSVALGFISSIDELFFLTLTKDAVRYMMDATGKFDLYDCSEEEEMTDEQCLEWQLRYDNRPQSLMSQIIGFLPLRLLVATFWMGVFIVDYYMNSCQRGEDGTWVSRPQYTPEHGWYFPLYRVFFPDWMLRLLGQQESGDPFWVPPKMT
eukprot:TRINITY_DN18954_c0_g1_i1.p1 TRINITY_DN18954_c0_g1~~TRINITY_DN18954_c0_g1_i1.p1  ORF type:complete len:469 (+),score=95.75 TRINITY_DN18954_c0_g1_i1:270-1676(+)